MLRKNSDVVLAAIREIHSADTQAGIVDILTDYVSGYGFSQIFLGQLVNPANVPLDQIMFLSTWPTELQARRQDQYAILHDPIARTALRSKRPFRWVDALKDASSKGRQIVGMTRDYGIRDGYMFPFHALDSVSGGVSLGGDNLSVSPEDISEIELVVHNAYSRLELLLGPFPYQMMVDLSPRECEVIQFAASGKTNIEIAEILGIQMDTVKKTLKRACEKLGASNRAHAVANAIAKNVIFA
ncbi:MAG: LuxR family transcriptional regulator [Henriciella sp.]|jgi:LuxR family quorum sensing-dependent transcriptional regulator